MPIFLRRKTPMKTNKILFWRQADREAPLPRARRGVQAMTTVLQGAYAIYEDQIGLRVGLSPHEVPFYARTLAPVTTALWAARTLFEAYDYYLARCEEAGLSLDDAHAAWQVHSSPAFEAELVEAEADGPNAMGMIDRQVLAKMGIAPHEDLDDAAEEQD
jgi:hypothetical protein